MNKRIAMMVLLGIAVASTAGADPLSRKVEEKYGADLIGQYRKLVHPDSLVSGKPQNVPEDSEPGAKALDDQTQQKITSLNPTANEMMQAAIDAQNQAMGAWGQQNKDKPLFDMFKGVRNAD